MSGAPAWRWTPLSPAADDARAAAMAALPPHKASAVWRLTEGDANERGGNGGPEASASESDYRLVALLIEGGCRDAAVLREIVQHSGCLVPGREDKLRRRDYLPRLIANALKNAKPEGPERPDGLTVGGTPTRTLAEILRDPDAAKPPVAVLAGLAWAGRITLVAAREGVGKSTLFSAAAAALTRGGAFLGEPVNPAPDPDAPGRRLAQRGSVLWVLVEEHQADLVIRALRFQTEPDRFVVLERPVETLTDLEAAVSAVRPTLVIVDTLHSWAAPLVKDASASDDWHSVLRALQTLARAPNGPAILMSAEAVKATGDYKDSTAIGHGVDVVLNLLRPSDDAPVRILKRKKARWPYDDLRVELVENEYRRADGVAPVDADADRLTAVLDAIGATAVNAVDLAEKLERGARGVEQDLRRLYADRKVDRSGGGKRGAYVYRRSEPGSSTADRRHHLRPTGRGGDDADDRAPVPRVNDDERVTMGDDGRRSNDRTF